MTRLVAFIFVTVHLSIVGSTGAGTYSKIGSESLDYDVFIVAHPFGYDGTGGEIVLEICSESATFGPALRAAIRKWNALIATTGNCIDCSPIEDPTPPDPNAPFDLASVMLHELGHCAMALGHTNWEATSHTATRETVGFEAEDPPRDGIRGSRDDRPIPLPGSRLIHWFRMDDNDPVVIDQTVIDGTTYSRRILDLPPGSSWPANGNEAVAEQVGFSNTQSVMYSEIREGSTFTGLDADAVNTVRFAMTGLDSVHGTRDDYVVRLEYQSNCSFADIVVKPAVFADEPETLGGCISDIEQISMDNVVHYRIFQDPIIGTHPFIEIAENQRFDVVFADDFESGTASGWDSAGQ